MLFHSYTLPLRILRLLRHSHTRTHFNSVTPTYAPLLALASPHRFRPPGRSPHQYPHLVRLFRAAYDGGAGSVDARPWEAGAGEARYRGHHGPILAGLAHPRTHSRTNARARGADDEGAGRVAA